MQYLDQLVSHLIETARKEEANRNKKEGVMTLQSFKFEKLAKELVVPARKCAEHHRSRERHYTQELEKAEAILREKGISMEVVDPRTGFSVASVGSVCSGAVSLGYEASNNPNYAPKFQPRVDQGLLGDVERAKTKMLDHGKKAEQYEKYARAFICCPPEAKIELSIEDVHFFRLEQ